MNAAFRAARPTRGFLLIDSKVDTEMPEQALVAGIAPEPQRAHAAPEVRA